MDQILKTITDNLVLPAIIAIAAIVIYILKKQLDRITKSIELKNELSTLEKQVSIRNKLIELIDESVKTAVAANMSLANDMKKSGHTLTEEQQEELRNLAERITISSLSSCIKENGILMEIIGGKETLMMMIKPLIEKHVYEYKISQSTD